MLGAGGSILLLPLLVSGAGLPTRDAVPLSLLAVTLLALAGSWIGGSLVKPVWFRRRRSWVSSVRRRCWLPGC